MSIRDKRLAAKMSQKELADKLLVHQAAVSKWESGVNPPLPKYCKQLARLFNCTVDEIMEEYTNAPSKSERPPG